MPNEPRLLGGQKMTAEVAVLNRFGVALAADSAVTVERVHKDQLKTKVLNTANKLFSLSKFEPVGVMIYNGASLSSIPWETIIKEFRRHLGRNKYDKLPEYADAMFSWLENHAMFTEEQKSSSIYLAIGRSFIALNRSCKTKNDFVKALDDAIAEISKENSCRDSTSNSVHLLNKHIKWR